MFAFFGFLVSHAAFPMDAESLSFESFPAEIAESILEYAMRSQPERAYHLAWVCHRWDEIVNSPFLTKKIIDSDPVRYFFDINALESRGADSYFFALVKLQKLCENLKATKDDFEDLFKDPYTSCAKNQTLPLETACKNAHTIAVGVLLDHGAIAKKNIVYDSLYTIQKIVQLHMNLDIACMLQCFKQVCEKNPRVARWKDIFMMGYRNARSNLNVLLQVFETLIGAGASINEYEKDEWPVLLHVYVDYCDGKPHTRKIATWLMEHGANPYMQLKGGESIYDYAKVNSDQRFLKLIETHWNKK